MRRGFESALGIATQQRRRRLHVSLPGKSRGDVEDRFIGLEKNAWAAEIAQLVLFLGHVQVWLDRTGVGTIAPTERGRQRAARRCG